MHRIVENGDIINIEGKGFYEEAKVRVHFETLSASSRTDVAPGGGSRRWSTCVRQRPRP